MFFLEKQYHYTGPRITDEMLDTLIRHVVNQYIFQNDPGSRTRDGRPDSMLHTTAQTTYVDGVHIHTRTALFATEEDAEATTRNYLMKSIDEELQIPYAAVGIRLEIKKETV